MLKKTLACALVLVALVFGAIAMVYQGSFSSLPVKERLVALTYDDGPNPPHTRALLDLLASREVIATFFPKARNAEAFSNELLAVAAGGHEIGNHSYYHRPMTSLSTQAMFEEVEKANEVLTTLLGERPRLFRPPYGIQGYGLWRALKQLEMPSVLMNTHGADWEPHSAQEIADRVLAGVQPGTIILLHDGHGDVDDPYAQDSRAATVEATGLIIDALHTQGYRFVSISELMRVAGVTGQY